MVVLSSSLSMDFVGNVLLTSLSFLKNYCRESTEEVLFTTLLFSPWLFILYILDMYDWRLTLPGKLIDLTVTLTTTAYSIQP